MSPRFSPIWIATLVALSLPCPSAHAVELSSAGTTGRMLVGSKLYSTPVGYTGMTYIHATPYPAPENTIVFNPDRGEVYIRDLPSKILARTRSLSGPASSVMVGTEADFQGAGLHEGDVLIDPVTLKVSDFKGSKFVPRAQDAAAPVRTPAAILGAPTQAPIDKPS